MNSEDVEKIKQILVKDEHLRLSKRFCLFVENNVGKNFFDYREERRIPWIRKIIRVQGNFYGVKIILSNAS